MEAITRKWNQFCSEGAWSTSCYNGFWGYYQPIRDAATSQDQLDDIFEENLYELKGGVFIRAADQVIGNLALGGQRADRPSEWVTLLESNGNTYRKASKLTRGPASHQAFYIYHYPGNPPPIFLILSPDQQKSLCGGDRCNLTQSR